MASNRSSTFYILFLVVALFLAVSSADGRLSLAFAIGRPMPAPPAPRCDHVYGAKQGDTCFAVALKFNFSVQCDQPKPQLRSGFRWPVALHQGDYCSMTLCSGK